MKKTKFFSDMGLCLHDGAMVYGVEHGVLRWAPMWLKHFICKVWNRVHCAIAGHDPIAIEMFKAHVAPGPPVCVNCSAKLKVDGRYPTPEELDVHNDLCQKEFERIHKQGIEDGLWNE